MNEEKVRVLIIEDDRFIARLIEKILQIQNFKVDRASSGEDGIRRADSEDFGLIILDFNLPDLDGTEVLKSLNESPRARKTPVILTTAHMKMPFDKEIFGERRIVFLEKPFERSDLIAKVREITESSDNL